MAQNPEATVVFGVLNETSETESRVALTPDIVTRLKRSGVSSLIEAGAGIAADYTDEDYEKAGAKVTSRDEVLAEADALGFVDRPSAETVAKLKAGQWVIGMLGSFTDADYVAALEKAGLVGIAIEKLPRKLSSAQSMDEMTSQNSVMGYKAAITAADAYGSFLPMMTTAAGTIRPAKALVLGAGIAGLQAIGTLKRLGAVVTAYDVRPASQGEVESLGAKFLDLGLDFSKGQGEGGYAREGVGQLYTGFAMIAPMYYAKTHKRAVFVPIYASRKHRTLTIGQGVVYDPDNNATAEKLRIVDALLDSMQAMYEQEAVNESPTSHPSAC